VRIATLNDLTAEWTGGILDAAGTRFFVSVQHNVTGQGVVLDTHRLALSPAGERKTTTPRPRAIARGLAHP
jgi:secreted PhoX family phosphatase